MLVRGGEAPCRNGFRDTLQRPDTACDETKGTDPPSPASPNLFQAPDSFGRFCSPPPTLPTSHLARLRVTQSPNHKRPCSLCSLCLIPFSASLRLCVSFPLDFCPKLSYIVHSSSGAQSPQLRAGPVYGYSGCTEA